MARKIFIAATGQNSGKTTTSLSLMHMARKKYKRVGFVKPIGPKPASFNGVAADKDAILMARVFDVLDDLPLMSPFVLKPGDTKRVLDGTLSRDAIRQSMLDAMAELDAKNDFLIIEGAGHSGVGSVLGFGNAEVARAMQSPVLMVAGGGVGNVVDAVHMNLALFEKCKVPVAALMANKIIPEKREQTLHYLGRAFAEAPFKVLGGFNYQPTLANPTLRRIGSVLGVEMRATEEEAQRIVHHVQIGTASTQRVAELLKESSLLIVNSSRDELLVTLANLYQIPEYREKIAGVVVPGVVAVSHITQKILDRSGLPYMRSHRTSTDVLHTISDDVSKLAAEDTHKIKLIEELAEKRFDFDAIDALLDI
ncbi:MAG: cobyrinic acid a,c-diamide synthase [Desulfuromonas sp.]|nr:MAG: cobyrinic acid a,c-diamide synthase [Desulfuromonas sp.]